MANWPTGPHPGYRHGVAAAHLGHLGAEVAGGEDVREQNRLIVADLRWQFDQPDVGERDTAFSLQTMEWSGGLRTAIERGAGLLAVRVGAIALGEVAGPAIGTVATGDGGGMTTRSPICRLRTSAPRASTMPTPSWPRMVPGCMPLTVPLTKCRSVPQIADAVMRTMASVGARMRGSGTSSKRISPTAVDNSFHGHSIGPARGPGRMLAERTSRLHGGKEDRANVRIEGSAGTGILARTTGFAGHICSDFSRRWRFIFSGAASSMRRGLAAF